MQLKRINAVPALNSRGKETIKVIIKTNKGIFTGIPPTGKSKSVFEATEIPTKKAINLVNNVLSKKIIKLKPSSLKVLEEFLIKFDNTKRKTVIGSNTLLAISIAFSKALAADKNLELFEFYEKEFSLKKNKFMPVPLMNFINAGLHAQSKLKIQEFLIIPIKFNSFSKALSASIQVHNELSELIKKKDARGLNLGNEGGFTPNLKNSKEVFSLLEKAISDAGYSKKIFLGIDCAASTFYSKGFYYLDNKKFSPEKLINYYIDLCNQFPIKSIEDPFNESSFQHFAELNFALKNKVQIVSDDLTASNELRVKKAISFNSCSAIILKPNQIGSLTELIKTAKLSRKNKIKLITSHRSGDSEDSFISDLAIALSSEQVKFGGLERSDRTSKYNRLIEINFFSKNYTYSKKAFPLKL